MVKVKIVASHWMDVVIEFFTSGMGRPYIAYLLLQIRGLPRKHDCCGGKHFDWAFLYFV